MVENVPTGKQTFKGGCHCRFVTYEVSFDPSDRTALRCNCTFCQKPGITNLSVSPEDFKLVSPSSKEEMSNYRPKKGNQDINRYFCGTCGTHIYREVGNSYCLGLWWQLLLLHPSIFPGHVDADMLTGQIQY